MARRRATGDAGGERPGRGARLVRVALLALLAVAVLIVLFTEVFPRVERLLDEPTLGGAAVLR